MNLKCTYSLDFYVTVPSRRIKEVCIKRLTEKNIKNHIFRILHSKYVNLTTAFAEFLLSFSPLSKNDTSYSALTRK